MATVTAGFANLLTPEFQELFVDVGEETPLEYPMVFNVENMEFKTEKELQISGLGQIPSKPEGTDFITDEPILGGTREYAADPFGLAVEITREMMEDDQFDVMNGLVAELARASRNRLEVDAWSVLNNAFLNIAGGGDEGFTAGESLVSTTHVGLDGVTRANRPAVDVAFGITGLQQALIRFQNLTNERGRPMALRPSMILISPDNMLNAREILGSDKKALTANNELNAFVEEDLKWMICHYFTAVGQWFLMANRGQHNLKFKIRSSPKFSTWEDPKSMNLFAAVWQRHTKGFGSWRGIDGSFV